MAHIFVASSVKGSLGTSQSFKRVNKVSPEKTDAGVEEGILEMDVEFDGSQNELLQSINHRPGFPKMESEKTWTNFEIVKLNVGGKMFNVRRSTLEKQRVGILSDLQYNQDNYLASAGMFFFDRNPKYFTAILDFYRTGHVHISRDFCGYQLEKELEFWGLTDDVISDCCWRRYIDLREEQYQDDKVRREFYDVCQVKLSRMKGLSVWRERMWVTLEDPSYSTVARVILCLYILMVLMSLVNASAVSYLRSRCEHFIQSTAAFNISAERDAQTDLPEMAAMKILTYIELGSLSLFAVFVFLRIAICPVKFGFWTNLLNILDLTYLCLSSLNIAIYLNLSFFVMGNFGKASQSVVHHFTMIIGILRIFRGARHYKGVRELWYAIRASFREVWLLSIFVFISIIIFGIVFYCSQKWSESEVDNIFLAFWWALITMTTVGYGDVVPTVPAGYIVAVLCALVGLVMISLPIPVIAHNFRLYYGYKSRSCRKMEKS